MLRTDKGRNVSWGIYKQRAEKLLSIKQNQTELLHNCLCESRRLSGSPLSLGGAWHPLCLSFHAHLPVQGRGRPHANTGSIPSDHSTSANPSTNTARGTREMTRQPNLGLWRAEGTLLGCVMGCTCVVCFVCLCEWAWAFLALNDFFLLWPAWEGCLPPLTTASPSSLAAANPSAASIEPMRILKLLNWWAE